MMMTISLSHAVNYDVDTGVVLNIKNGHLETNKSMSNNHMRIYPPFLTSKCWRSARGNVLQEEDVGFCNYSPNPFSKD